jgi:hypothetical protein
MNTIRRNVHWRTISEKKSGNTKNNSSRMKRTYKNHILMKWINYKKKSRLWRTKFQLYKQEVQRMSLRTTFTSNKRHKEVQLSIVLYLFQSWRELILIGYRLKRDNKRWSEDVIILFLIWIWSFQKTVN